VKLLKLNGTHKGHIRKSHWYKLLEYLTTFIFGSWNIQYFSSLFTGQAYDSKDTVFPFSDCIRIFFPFIKIDTNKFTANFFLYRYQSFKKIAETHNWNLEIQVSSFSKTCYIYTHTYLCKEKDILKIVSESYVHTQGGYL
jgi:hypothetical protein